QTNRNTLLWQDPSVDGIKTGHTESAGYCLVASAEKEAMRLVSVVMGAKSMKARIRETQKLLNYGFRFYQTDLIFPAGKPIRQVKVWKGAKDQVSLGVKQDVYVTFPRNQKQFVSQRYSLPDRFIAPVTRGRFYGMVNIDFNGQPIASAQLEALEEIPEGSWFKLLQDEFWLLFE
ncbi:MAG: D-alanyl-D-alanine carboxypeptidase, partial [Gammaproteobacteria bacterium]